MQRPPHGIAAGRDRHLHECVHGRLAHDVQPFRSGGRLGALPCRHLALDQALRQLGCQLSYQRRQQPGEDSLVEEGLAVMEEKQQWRALTTCESRFFGFRITSIEPDAVKLSFKLSFILRTTGNSFRFIREHELHGLWRTLTTCESRGLGFTITLIEPDAVKHPFILRTTGSSLRLA